ncbi:MAG: hypothetical protein JW712_14305 [Dehalococcoidales bacterium]|nr:hypothetical protein [Dehalococcoidales bacterium]
MSNRDSFLHDPSMVFYLPLHRLDGNNLVSGDKHGHVCQSENTSWNIQGHYFNGVDSDINCSKNPLFVNDDLTVLVMARVLSLPTENSYTPLFCVWDKDGKRSWLISSGIDQSSFAIVLSDNGDYHTGHIKEYMGLLFSLMSFCLYGFTFIDGNLTLYRDGEEEPVTKLYDYPITSLYHSSVPLYLGCTLDAGEKIRFMNGIIGEAMIFNRGLSSLEIRKIYESIRHRYC